MAAQVQPGHGAAAPAQAPAHQHTGATTGPAAGEPLKYAYTVLYVKDVDLSLRFYSAAFGLRPKLVYADKTWAELDTGSTSLAFTPLVQREAALVGTSTVTPSNNLPMHARHQSLKLASLIFVSSHL